MDFLETFKKNTCDKANKIAVRFGNESITYSQLNNMSDAIVGFLRQHNVNKGTFVGVLMNRSIDVIVTLLGIMKYGCGFLPIDINYPAERIKYVIDDSNIECVICNDERVLDCFPKCVLLEKSTDIRFEKWRSPENAYMIYTSGSTGNPKGVIIGYDSLNNVLEAFSNIISMSSDDVLYAITTFSFDISILELFLPLYSGAEVVISNKRAQIDPIYLQKELIKNKVTVMQATPITWNMLIGSGWSNENGMRVLCGGEALTEKLAQKLLERANDVWNVYGPTETTIWSSVYKLVPDKEVAIGNPIDNTKFLILDEQRQPANFGELYIGGVGVSKGYWNRENLNKEKFVIIDNIHYYATGDIVKSKGDLYYYVCRKDYQVKVNGHRIELGEIESIISKIPEIKGAVVLFEKNKLVAFIQENSEIKDEKVIDSISKFLPNYMIPQEIIRLGDFPHTDNNKISRTLLWELVLDSVILEDQDIYSQGLSSFEVMRLVVYYAKRGYLLHVDDLFGGKTIRDALTKSSQNNLEEEENTDFPIWELQKQMAMCKFLYPESEMYYERCILHFPSFEPEYLYSKLTELFDKLDISCLEPRYKKGTICWQKHSRKVVKRCQSIYSLEISKDFFCIFVDNQGEVEILFHHSLLDGESIRLLACLICDYLEERSRDISQYNGFFKANSLIKDNCFHISEKIDVINIFDNHKHNDDKLYCLSTCFEFDTFLSNIHKFNNNFVPFLHYVVVNSLYTIIKDNITYGCVVSNRMYTNREKVLGNFINIISMCFDCSQIKDIEAFMKKYKHNMSKCNRLYNAQNVYPLNVIIHDLRNDFEYQKIVQSKKVELLPEYENNVFPINLRFDIMDRLYLTLSYSGSCKQELIYTFFNNLSEMICEEK